MHRCRLLWDVLICQRFQSIPGPVGPYLCDFTTKIYAELEATVTKSIWMKTKIKGTDILVRNSKLTGENPEPISKFVGNLMRAYRNGHHGYFSSDREPRPSRYLFLVDGTVPDSLVHLPSLWLLAYLMDPSIVGWNHLAISSYDLK